MKTLGIFGSWRPQPNDPDYQLARQVGKLATRSGWRIATGGYSGIMEAASQGSVEAGGSPVGVTCPEIDVLLSHNTWVRERIQAVSLAERQAKCLSLCQAALFFPGRTGTVAELALAAELRSKGVLQFPIILMGNFWESFFTWLNYSNSLLAHSADEPSGKRLFMTVKSAEDAVQFLTDGNQ